MLKDEIEKVVEMYCDGTYNGLSHGHLIEYFSDGVTTPQTLADELFESIKRLLIMRAVDECLICGTKFIFAGKHVSGALVCGNCGTRH